MSEKEYEIYIEDVNNEVFQHVLDNVNFNTYSKMNEESKRKLIEKSTITYCLQYAPKRRYGLTKDEVRELVRFNMNYIAGDIPNEST